jgi:Phosphoenolpyruvate phosphomutase
MLHDSTSAAGKRAAFRAGLASGRLLRFPGAFNPLSAMLIARHGFEGVYVSGAVISADLGLPDIGLTTLSEVAGRAQQIARVTGLPSLVDADTGFGEPMNAARTVQVLEDAGLAGPHIEDQLNPKRCGHLDGKDVTDAGAAVKRIKAAVAARRDPAFVIAARLHLHRARRHVHAVGHLQRDHRGHRRAQGPAARRRQRSRDGHDGGDRHPRPRRGMAAQGPSGQAEDHGLRPSRLQERRLPGPDRSVDARKRRRTTRLNTTAPPASPSHQPSHGRLMIPKTFFLT